MFPIAFSQPLSDRASWRRSRRAATAGQPLKGPKPGAEVAKSLECCGHVLGICKYNHMCMNICYIYHYIYHNIYIYTHMYIMYMIYACYSYIYIYSEINYDYIIYIYIQDGNMKGVHQVYPKCHPLSLSLCLSGWVVIWAIFLGSMMLASA